MGKIWPFAVALSVVYAVFSGRAQEATQALLDSGGSAVQLMLTVMGTMALWSGLMEILAEAGDLARMGKAFQKLLKPLFPGVADEECWSAMSMNLAANLLGLGNAATPAGIEAAKRLAAQGETGLRALAMLLVLNNSGVQLMPTTVITLRQVAGSADPGSVWLPAMAVSLTSAVTGVMLMALLRGRGRNPWRT